MSSDGISALERGHRRTPQRETLALLAGALALKEEQLRAFEIAAARWELLTRPGETSVTLGPWPDATPSALPLALTSFVGREMELGEIAALVRMHRLVTVTGPGGVGKTQTTLHVATALPWTENAVRFVGFAQVADPSLVATAIASALGVQEVANHPLFETLLVYLKNKAVLLIFDNCEHLIVEVRSVVEALLLNCPQVRVLATSREPLRFAGEHSYRLSSLGVPSAQAAHRIGAADATTYGAIALFVDRAHAVDHRFALTDENAPIVAELCRGLDGIPLAIELAAARVNVLSVRALGQRLDDRFRILAAGGRKGQQRQETMRSTIDWSYDLLSAAEQRMLERLSVFAGGCTLGTAAAVSKYADSSDASEDDVLDLLSSLVDKSLLIADLEGREPRYRLLEPFREYVREKLAARGELQIVARCHALACLQLAEQLERAVNYGPDDDWRALVREELGNWRLALQWTLGGRGDVLLGQRLVGGLNIVWKYFARVEGRRWITLALELTDHRTSPSVLASLTYNEATVAWQLREYQRHLAGMKSAAARFRAVGDSLEAARADDAASVALFALGRFAEAQALNRDALAVARKAGHQLLIAYGLRGQAFIGARLGNAASARAYIAEALQIYDSLGKDFEAALTLNDLADVESGAGNSEVALRHATDAFARLKTYEDLNTATMDVRSDLARYLIQLGRYDEAEEHARETLDFARERHEEVYAACALQHLGAIAALRLQHVEHTPEHSRAARILGFSDARLAALGSAPQPGDKVVRDAAVGALREATGAEAVAKLMAAGAAMTEAQAFDEALTA